jgi:aryl-alcohol dehydrogenase-like predicted oxidoreductase
MRTRKLGWTGLELSVVGFGTWAAGGAGWKFAWGPQDDNDTVRAIHEAIDSGINWIDTAAVYGLGHAEEVVGKAVKAMRVRPAIATKCSRRWNHDGSELYGSLKREDIKAECEMSLKRLGVDIIDLYQIHWPNPEQDLEEGWGAVMELKKEGKIKFGGVSNFSAAQMEKISPIGKPASLQPPYSMFRRDIENDQLPYCKEHNIGVVVYSPMEKGLLTGKVTKEWFQNLPASDHRKNDSKFNEPELSKNLAKIEKLKAIAYGLGITLAQLAIAWILRRGEVTAAIAGARKPGQILETAKAGDIMLSPEDIKNLESALA